MEVQILSTAPTLGSLVKFDQYITAILLVTGYDEKDLIKRTLERIENSSDSLYEDELSQEVRQFLRNPDSARYLKYAYKKYQLDKLAEEQEKLKQELDEL